MLQRSNSVVKSGSFASSMWMKNEKFVTYDKHKCMNEEWMELQLGHNSQCVTHQKIHEFIGADISLQHEAKDTRIIDTNKVTNFWHNSGIYTH
jgi:hypothetical protein